MTPSFPTRRSSDLLLQFRPVGAGMQQERHARPGDPAGDGRADPAGRTGDECDRQATHSLTRACASSSGWQITSTRVGSPASAAAFSSGPASTRPKALFETATKMNGTLHRAIHTNSPHAKPTKPPIHPHKKK